jgi:hypothetical protein
MDDKSRLKAMSMRSIDLAQRIGVRPATISDNLAGRADNRWLCALVDALELMTPAQRESWLGR